MSISTNSDDSQSMRWAPAPEYWHSVLSGLRVRAISNLALGADVVFGSRIEQRFGILMYHRVSPRVPGLPAPSINVTPRRFRLQMEGLLRIGFHVWPLRRVLECHAAGETIPNQVTVVTFDDGFESFYTHAVPVLKDLNIPATVFLNTEFLDTEAPFPFDHWANAYRSSAPPETYRCMSRQQCLELLDEPLIELGAHTHTHQDFRGRPAEFRQDLQACLGVMKAEFALERPAFAFPYGTPHLGFAAPNLVAIARQLSVSCALTTESKLIAATDDPFHWGRLNVFPWDNGPSIAARLHGWYCWAPQLQRRLARMLRPTSSNNQPIDADYSAVFSSLDQDRIARTTSAREPAHTLPLISVIMPTYNRAHWLTGAIESLARQETHGEFRYEIIVVDNASADDTPNVVASLIERFPKTCIRYLRQTRPGDAPTRNEGIRAAAGEWLAFFDDDQFADPNWLWELLEASNVTAAHVIGGPVHLDLPDDQLQRLGTICRKALREIAFYPCLHPYIDRDLPGTGNALVARQVFDKVGLFDESFTSGGSDSDWFLRAQAAGFELWYTPRATIRHRIPPERLTREYFRWDALSGGAGYAELFDYQRHGVFGLSLRCALRAAHGLVVTLPLMLWANLRGDAGEALGRRTLLWRLEGYVRKTLAILFPRWLAQRAFFESLDFRCGRSVGQASPQPAAQEVTARH